MTLLSLNGKLLSLGGNLLAIGDGMAAPAPSAVAPSQVGSLAAGAPGTYTIPVTYTAASGTATISYGGRVALRGSTSFTPNGGTFTATSGQFVGLSAGTAYDLEIVATNSAGSSVTSLLNITTAAAPVVVVPSGAANRYDLVMDQSSVAPGSAATGSACPNGTWTGGNVTLTPSAGGSAQTLALPSSGTAPVGFNFTSSAAGEIDLVGTNTAGLYNPLPARLTVFAGSSGTARSLAAASARADRAGFLYSRLGARPRGFGVGVGFGPVWLNLTALGGATDGLWARLYDAASNGATTVAGSGTELTSGPVQVHGSVSGTGTVRVMLPALATESYVDLATDAAFTSPARVPQRLCVGLVMGHASRSQEAGMERSYASTGQPTGVTYAKAASWAAYDARYSNTGGDWFVHDGVSSDPYQYHDGKDSSAALMEFGRLVETKLGVLTRVSGVAASGGGIDQFLGHDGSLSGAFTDTVAFTVGGEYRVLWTALAGWDSVDGTNYPNEYPTEGPNRLRALPAKVAVAAPSCAVILMNTGDSGWFGPNGSQATGERRDGQMLRDQVQAVNPMVVSRTDMIWNEFAGGHATQGARIYYARQGLQAFLDAEIAVMGGNQSAVHGPRLATNGTWNKTTNVLSIPFKHFGGTNLLPIGVSFSTPSSTVGSATPAEIASMFSVYPGAGQGWGNGRAVQISTATINTSSPPYGYAGTIDLALVVSGGALVNGIDSSSQNFGTGTQAMPSAFNVHFGDFGVSNRTLYPNWQGAAARSAALVDDHDDLGVGYGRQMAPQLDIVVS